MKKSIEISLQFASNMNGALKPEIIKRVQKYINNPTIEKWEDIHCIIISSEGMMKTIWNAINDLNPFFPRYGRKTNDKGEVIREWEQIPTPEDVVKAINKCVFSNLIQTN